MTPLPASLRSLDVVGFNGRLLASRVQHALRAPARRARERPPVRRGRPTASPTRAPTRTTTTSSSWSVAPPTAPTRLLTSISSLRQTMSLKTSSTEPSSSPPHLPPPSRASPSSTEGPRPPIWPSEVSRWLSGANASSSSSLSSHKFQGSRCSDSRLTSRSCRCCYGPCAASAPWALTACAQQTIRALRQVLSQHDQHYIQRIEHCVRYSGSTIRRFQIELQSDTAPVELMDRLFDAAMSCCGNPRIISIINRGAQTFRLAPRSLMLVLASSRAEHVRLVLPRITVGAVALPDDDVDAAALQPSLRTLRAVGLNTWAVPDDPALRRLLVARSGAEVVQRPPLATVQRQCLCAIHPSASTSLAPQRHDCAAPYRLDRRLRPFQEAT